MKTIGILFPFKETDGGGVFKASRTTQDALRSDLIALLTLRKGQRPMQSKMYSPIYKYIHEPMDDVTEKNLEREIKEKVRDFIPQIDVKKVKYTRKEQENLLGIMIVYTIKELFDIEESIELNIPINQL